MSILKAASVLLLLLMTKKRDAMWIHAANSFERLRHHVDSSIVFVAAHAKLRDGVFSPLVTDIDQLRIGVESVQTRCNLYALIESQVSAENRIYHQVSETASTDLGLVGQICGSVGHLQAPPCSGGKKLSMK